MISKIRNDKMKQFGRKLTALFLTLNFFLPQIVNSTPMAVTPDYISFIQQKVNLNSIYPQQARLKGWEGIVKVRFTISEDGRIKDIDIAESSGYPLLDAAAMLAIKDASPYPFPDTFPKKEIELVLPINFTQEQQTTKISILDQPKTDTKPYQSTLETVSTASNKLNIALLPIYNGDMKASAPAKVPLDMSFDHFITTETPKPVEEFPAGQRELNTYIEEALKNNQPTEVAYEEIELAQLKVSEAQRNLYPNVKLSSYYTDGEVFKVGYQEGETKIQIDQPIFHGGELKDTVIQAQVNLDITKKNYDRLKLDVINKTEIAYYNLVSSKIHMIAKQDILREAKDLMAKIEKLYSIDMAIALEVNSARSYYEQIEMQIKSIKQELFMAQLTLKQVMNVKGLPQITLNGLPTKKLDLSLNKCLEQAFLNRPEVYLSQMLMEFNNYGKKIEKDKDKFQVDATTSYGYYRGGYKTEKMLVSNNWYAGMKVTKPLGASTASGSVYSDHSEKRFGQTSPTQGTTVAGEVNFLDNLKRLSDRKKADIELLKSLSDFNETAKTVAFEVQDTFLNYQKALLQLNSAEAEMKFRRNEAQVIKIRSMVADASLSNAMESIYSYSEAQTRYIQALANYYISLANLKKATGYGLTL